MFELFGLMVAALVLTPVVIGIGLMIAVLCGIGNVLGFVWQVGWGICGVVLGLFVVAGLVAAGVLTVMMAVVL